MKKLLLALLIPPVFCKAQISTTPSSNAGLPEKGIKSKVQPIGYGHPTHISLGYIGNCNPDSAPKTADMSKATLITPPKDQSGIVINYNGKKTDTGAFKYDSPGGAIILPSEWNKPSPAGTYTVSIGLEHTYGKDNPPKTVYKWQDFLKIFVIIGLGIILIVDKLYQIKLPEYGEDE